MHLGLLAKNAEVPGQVSRLLGALQHAPDRVFQRSRFGGVLKLAGLDSFPEGGESGAQGTLSVPCETRSSSLTRMLNWEMTQGNKWAQKSPKNFYKSLGPKWLPG